MKRRVRTAVFAFCIVFAVVMVSGAADAIRAAVPRALDIERLPVIILDAGHGGMDGGAVASGGLMEKEINLAITLKLRDMLTALGFEVVLTREDDRSIHDEGVQGVRRQKTSDLHNRLAIAQQYSPNVIFLSIHQNKFQDTSSHGAQIFYSPNHTSSEVLARILQDTIIEMVQPENQRDIKKAGDNLYLMHEAECPAVLIECGFLSNISDTPNLT
ncbi:MAG: N-acetylmuramoyl-L-alanine amidase, partial [Oscillospiraceae bacterium]|nr:N-acetylmuramoyl-L-alanine amidase [Oscillospiraceae bacterium]